MAGAVISALGVIGYFSVSQLVAHIPNADKQVAVSSATTSPSSHLAPAAPSLRTEGGADVLTPSSPQYQVQTGDNLGRYRYEKLQARKPETSRRNRQDK